MSVSSYLEAFLTVYGWHMYYVLYLLFGTTGFFLYPMARIVNDVLVRYLSGSEYAGTNFLRQMLTSMCLVVIVFAVALVPAVKISLTTTTVKTVCADKTDVEKVATRTKDAKGDRYFSNSNTRVPLVPWLAMSIGQGISSVIYQQTPCAIDITKANAASMNVNIDDAENAEQLKHEYGRFLNECHQKAVGLTKEILLNKKDKYGDKASKALQVKLDEIMDSTKKTKQQLLENPNSLFIREVFYSENSPLKNFPETKTIVPIKPNDPVAGFNGYDADASKQGGTKSSPPSCGQWWSGGGVGIKPLRKRLLTGLEASLLTNIAATTSVPECESKVILVGNNMGGRRQLADQDACKSRVVSELYKNDGNKMTDDIFDNLQGTSRAQDKIMPGSANLVAGAGVVMGIAASFFGKDFGQSEIVGSIGGFYMTLMILKFLLHYLLPMVLMTVYMFWGVYMIVAEFRGSVVIKGMILIIVLTLMPSLWALMDHLDDGLYEALYGGWSMSNPLDRIFLDIATSIFQLGIVFVVFFLINDAGGGSVGSSVNETQNMASSMARNTGSPISKTITKSGGAGGSKIGSWGKTTIGKIKQKMTPYKVTQPGAR